MRRDIRRFVELAAKTLPLRAPVYEFGALQVSGDPDEDLRPLFPGLEYIGCDMRPGPGVDCVLDLHALLLPDCSAGTVLLLDTLEHVEHPRRAMRELERVLQPGGIALVSTVMDFPIHGHPNDYWRFTPEGLASLMKVFDNHFVGFYGPDSKPHTVVAAGFKGAAPEQAAFLEAYRQWQHRNNLILRRLAATAAG